MHGGTFAGDITKLSIGNGVFINTGVSLHPTGGITIGDNVSFGPRCVIMTGTHEIGPSEKRASDPTQFKPVTIGPGTWLGAGVIVYPGVTIGEGCVIAPGSVVTSDCEPDHLYAGVPAVRKRELPRNNKAA
ncbi:succinyltransferase-like protein [Rhodococcus sp. OK519]|uniref:acyltransferase n=1 Tax=Rhodococcus sp. OK519 TaxID=2135729 RepID=UPI000D38F00E|nr:succinyltransferase-like protein [Rhodococcus sp. OK519]